MDSLQLLKELIEIPSVFPNEGQIAKYCADFIRKNNFNVELIEVEKNRYNVIATKGNQKNSVLLFGHLDTVPPYGYDSNPFKMKIEGDKIKGLGSWDMKAGLAIIMSATSKLKLKNIGLKMVFTCDEENNSLGSHMVFRKEFLKGVVLAITPEITDNVKNNKDHNTILLGRRGRIVYDIKIKGVAGHGAALKGISAISVASKLVEHIEGLRLNEHDFLGKSTIFVRKIDGNSTSLSLPETCILHLDVHYVPSYTKETLLYELKKIIENKFSEYLSKGIKINVEVVKRNTPYLEPYITDKNNTYVKKTIDILSKKIKKLSISAGLTVADENIVGQFVPTITLGPVGGDAHSSEEWVSKKSIIEMEKFYKEVLENII